MLGTRIANHGWAAHATKNRALLLFCYPDSHSFDKVCNRVKLSLGEG